MAYQFDRFVYLAMVVDASVSQVVCSNCFKFLSSNINKTNDPIIPCQGGCGQAVYCSETCQTTSWSESHSFECSTLKIFHEELKWEGMQWPETAWLLLRVLVERKKELERDAEKIIDKTKALKQEVYTIILFVYQYQDDVLQFI
jgi:hypothetical protein